MDRKQVAFRVKFQKDGKRYEYSQAIDTWHLTRIFTDSTGGPFSMPDRSRIREFLDRERMRFEEYVTRQAFKKFGSMFGISYGPRTIVRWGRDEAIDDGNALEMELFPQTPGEVFTDAMIAIHDSRKGEEPATPPAGPASPST